MVTREEVLAELSKRGITPQKLEEIKKQKSLTADANFSLPKETMKLAAETALTPVRGIKALGVAAQKGIEKMIPGGLDPSGEDILNRSAEATQPGFQPQKGEKAGAFLGEQAAIAGLTAPATAARAGATGVKAIASLAARGGLTSGGLTAVQDLADKGVIDVKSTVRSAAFGTVFPIVAPTLGFISRVAKTGGKMLSKAGTNVSREAIEETSKIPLGEMSKYQNVQQKVESLQKGVFGALDEAGTELNKARAKLGLPDLKEVRRAQLTTQGEKLRPLQDVLQDAEERMKLAVDNGFPKDAQRFLDDIIHELDNHIEFAGKEGRNISQTALKEVRKELKGAMAKTPGGDILQAFEKEYSVVKGAADELYNASTNEGLTEQLVQRILKKDENLVGNTKELLTALREIERRTGKDLVNPVKKALAAREVSNVKATSLPGTITEALGPNFVRGLSRTSEVVGGGAENLSRLTPTVAPGLASTLFQGGKRREKK